MGKENGSWLTSAAPVIGSAIDAASGIFSGLFNANQARKNRAFQERMYKQQLEDNIKLWNMQNQYNLPSAIRQRMEDAGLNPLLMYEGGTSLTSSSMAQGANAPSGDSARADLRTNFAQGATQAALIRAQIANINADTEQKQATAEQSKASTDNLQFDVMFKRLCADVDKAIKHGTLANINASTNQLYAQILNTNEMTFQTAATMRQAREIELKRYDLDFNTIGVQLQQGWKQIANDTERVKQGWRDLSLKWIELQNSIRWTNEQIGALRWNVLKDKAMFAPTFQNLTLQNKLLKWDEKLKAADFNTKQIELFNKMMRNYYLHELGTETPGPWHIDSYWKAVRKPTMRDMLLVPKLKL